MKSKFKIVTMLFLLLLISTNTEAQFLRNIQRTNQKIAKEAHRRAQRRAHQKAQQKAEQKINNEIDKAFDKVENEIDREKSDNTNEAEQDSQQVINGMLSDIMSGKEITTKNTYTFNIKATIQIIDYTKRNKEPIQILQSYGKNVIMIEIENPKNTIISDFDNEAAIMFDSKSKTAKVMSLSFMKRMSNKNNTSQKDTAKMVKTGKSKKINGYSCYQYIITDQDSKIDAWLAPNVKFDYQDYLSGINKMFGNKKSNTASLLNNGKGYVMKMTMFDNGKKQSEMKVVRLSETPITIKMSNYIIEKMF